MPVPSVTSPSPLPSLRISSRQPTRAAVGDVAALVSRQVNELDFSASIELKAGKFSLPTNVGSARVKVTPGTVAAVSFHVERVDHRATVTRAELRFVNGAGESSPLIIKNPAEAGAGSHSPWSSFRNWVQDTLVDVRFEGISLEEDGRLSFDGQITGLGCLINRPLMSVIPREQLPTFNRELERIVSGNVVLREGVSVEGVKPVDIDALTTEIAKVLGRMNCKMSVDTDRFVLLYDGGGSKSGVGVGHLHGAFRAEGQPGFGPGGAPLLKSVTMSGAVELEHPAIETTSVRPESFSAQGVSLKGTLRLAETATLGEVAGDATVTISALPVTRVNFGPLRAEVTESMGLTLELDGLKLNPATETFSVHGTGKLPRELSPVVETLEVDITEQGGVLTLAGESDVDNFRYVRKIPALA